MSTDYEESHTNQEHNQPNQGKDLSELFSDIIKQLSNDNDYLLKISEKALKQHRRTKKTLEYLSNIREIVNSKDILYIDEIRHLREEVVRISRENVDARRELEKLKEENNKEKETCIDCFDKNQEVEMTPASKEENEFFDKIVEDLTDKVNNNEMSPSEYHQYVSLLSHPDVSVRHQIALQLGYHADMPDLVEVDLSHIQEDATPLYPEDTVVVDIDTIDNTEISPNTPVFEMIDDDEREENP